MSVQSVEKAKENRVSVLAILGSTLLVTGIYSGFTIGASLFGRYMFVEDLGLGEDTTFAVTRMTPTDRTLFVIAGSLVILGLIAIVSAIVRRRLLRSKN